MNDAPGMWTGDDYAGLPGAEKIELWNGRFVGPTVLERRMGPWPRSVVELRLVRALGEHVFPDGLGLVGPGFRGDDGRNVYPPDLAFVRVERLPSAVDAAIPGAPDLAIDVLSQRDEGGWGSGSAAAYLAGGVPLVWIADPWGEHVTVHTAAGSTRLQPGDRLSGGVVLPGFDLAIADLFHA